MWLKQIKAYWGIVIILGVLSVPFADCLHPLRVDIPYSQVVYDRQDNLLQAFLSQDDKWRLRSDVSSINPDLLKVLVTKEDRFFYWHPGVNPIAVIRAAFNNAVRGERTSGASTITMQVARLLNPGPRNLASKIREMFLAFRLEWHYSKREIFNLYINLLPYGGNIEGIKAASLLYYSKFPEQLSLGEIAALAVIPNDPERYRFDRDRNALQVKRDLLLNYLERRSGYSTAMIQAAKSEEVTGRRRALPVRAPHYTRRLVRSNPHLDEIHGTLDSEIHEETQQMVRAYSKQIAFKGIRNMAVVILDNESRSVLAYVGSQDFYDNEHGGQVDGIRALRAPGSTLKPLIYGMAFDHGSYSTKSVMTDLPVNYGGYSPENYDETYRGRVTADESLASSLNIPAVKVLDQLGHEQLVDRLAKADFDWIANHKDELGLSLALGGCGVRLEELANLYASFAQSGSYLPLKFKLDSPQNQDTIQILSPSASYMLYTILSRLDRPDLPNESLNATDVPKVSWKTGTSYGRRDAWSIGYNKRYTVAVWAGNFNGEGRPELSGADIATPLMLRIFRAIENRSTYDAVLYKPHELAIRYVCQESGLPPNTYCNDQVFDYAIPNTTTSETCQHMRTIWTNDTRTVSYCGHCLPSEGVLEELYPNLPPDLISYYDQEHISYKRIPPHEESCDYLFSSGSIEITQPEADVEYFIDSSANEKLALKADFPADVQEVYWYVNDVFHTSGSPGKTRFFIPTAGINTVTCRDDKGRSKEIQFQVTFL